VADAEDVLLRDKGHLGVDLGELRLPVGTQVLVPEAAGDLEVPVVAGHHEELLVDLRRLRQRVELAGVDPTRDEVVPGALRGAPREHRRLDLPEALGRQVVAHELERPVTQLEGALELLAAQVEVAVTKPQLDRKSTRLNSSHVKISYAVFCLKKK